MICLGRSFAISLLLVGIAVLVGGCAPRQAEPPAQPAGLEALKTTVPKLSGLPLKNAQNVLAVVGLKVGEVSLYDTDKPELHAQVFEQEPPAGTPVKGGTAVNVKVYRHVP